LAQPLRSGQRPSAWQCPGQGWGIDKSRGGFRTYEAMRRTGADFFVHCGDTVYADGPIQPEVRLPDGGTWRNLVTPEVSKVAETLAEFRGRHRYNLMDRNVRAFHAKVPQEDRSWLFGRLAARGEMDSEPGTRRWSAPWKSSLPAALTWRIRGGPTRATTCARCC